MSWLSYTWGIMCVSVSFIKVFFIWKKERSTHQFLWVCLALIATTWKGLLLLIIGFSKCSPLLVLPRLISLCLCLFLVFLNRSTHLWTPFPWFCSLCLFFLHVSSSKNLEKTRCFLFYLLSNAFQFLRSEP